MTDGRALETLIVNAIDETGRPVAGAFVTVEWGTAPTPEITLLTDAEGRVRLGLPPGRFRIRVASPGGSEGSGEANVPGPSKVLIIQLIKKL